MDGSIKYTLQLSSETRQRLESITRNGSATTRKILRARVLLMSDAHHELGRYPDQQIALALRVHPNTVARLRKRFLQQGEQSAISRKIRLTSTVMSKRS